MTSQAELTTLLPTPYLLIYALPLLLFSLAFTFTGTFLTLDRTRTFPARGTGAVYASLPMPGSFDHFKKRTLIWNFEGGIGGLIGGFIFGGMWIPSILDSWHCNALRSPFIDRTFALDSSYDCLSNLVIQIFPCSMVAIGYSNYSTCRPLSLRSICIFWSIWRAGRSFFEPNHTLTWLQNMYIPRNLRYRTPLPLSSRDFYNYLPHSFFRFVFGLCHNPSPEWSYLSSLSTHIHGVHRGIWSGPSNCLTHAPSRIFLGKRLGAPMGHKRR